MTISADSIISRISGFDITIAHEGIYAAVYDIMPGDIFDSCGWEYFTYRQISADTVLTFFPQYPVNLINIVGLASLSGGSSSSCNLSSATLAELDIKLTHLWQGYLEDDFVSYRFFWRDCNDNVLTSVSGDTLFYANQLFQDYSPYSPPQEIILPYPGFGIPDQLCSGPNDEEVLNMTNFVNSGIFWRSAGDSISGPIGDINLNQRRFEVADAVMFANYFIFGIGVFRDYPQGQIQQTDINGDGNVLSVGDFVLLIRIIIEDYWYYEKPVTEVFQAEIELGESTNKREVRFRTNNEISAVYLRIFPEDGEQLSIADFQYDHPNLMTGQIGDTITMLFVDMEDNQVLASGTHNIFEYFGDANFNILGSAVDIYGRETALTVTAEIVLPETPILHQNYPNPFNPSTTIEFVLPVETDWRLEIYNVTGQKIKSFSGNGAGSQAVFWNGTNNSGQKVSSGVYFYKLMASGVSNSRKMLLLK